MDSPSLRDFVDIGIRALTSATLGCGVAAVVIFLSFPTKATRKPPADDLCLIMFLGSLTGAVVSLSFGAVRLWRLQLANEELRDLRP